ncbi:MAG: YqiJ family protein [Candidatus Accumulibacter sp.]|jgi:hypothetical protein|nr:YqiJ family protein [Accumulibacter sp.]
MTLPLFLSEHCLVFTAALTVMLMLTVFEGVSLLFGGGNFFSVLGEAGETDALSDISAEGDVDGDAGAGGVLLAWLHVGRVPVLMLLIIFLSAFGISGLVIQALVRNFFHAFLPAWAAGSAAFFIAIPMVRWCGFALIRILPGDESQAVSLDSLIGRAGVVVTGTARIGAAAQARVRDGYGRFHYVLVEPDDENTCFEASTEVLIVKRTGGLRFQAIKNPHAGLMDS